MTNLHATITEVVPHITPEEIDGALRAIRQRTEPEHHDELISMLGLDGRPVRLNKAALAVR